MSQPRPCKVGLFRVVSWRRKEHAMNDNSIISLKKFTATAGVSPVTVWRWRRAGWLPTIIIAGKPYLSSEAIAEFKQRAERGDFAKPVMAGPR